MARRAVELGGPSAASHVYGFDSFAGLPEVNLDDEDPHIRKRQRQGPRAKGISKGQDGTYMGPGGYNAAKRLNVSDPTLLMDRIKRTGKAADLSSAYLGMIPHDKAVARDDRLEIFRSPDARALAAVWREGRGLAGLFADV